MKRSVVVLSVVLMIVWCGSRLARADSVTLVGDAHTRSTSASSNFGTSRSLIVQGPPATSTLANTYLQFDLSSLPPGTTGGSVTQATLRLGVNSVRATGSIDVFRITGDWTEASLTANTAPTMAGTPEVSGVALATTDRNDFKTIDVTPLVKDWVSGAQPNHGIALVANAEGVSAELDSKESTGTGHLAELDIVLDSVHEFGAGNTFVGTTGNDTMTGGGNTGLGVGALILNAGGISNTAIGAGALTANTGGIYSTAVGAAALENNDANYNTAVGRGALNGNTIGSENTAIGMNALVSNNTGSQNAALGSIALQANTTGNVNVAIGSGALLNNTTGTGNIAIGANAGLNLTTGNSNIDIGHSGVAGESSTIRLGYPGSQTATYIQGIHGAAASGGVPVFVDATGKLGTSGPSTTPGQALTFNGSSWGPTSLVNSLSVGSGLSASSSTGNVTLSNQGVLSVAAGAPLSSSGGQNPSISLSGVVSIANGGTGASDGTTARTNLGAAASGFNSDISALLGITGNINLAHSTATAGNIQKGGGRFLHDFGTASTFVGGDAGNFSMTGVFNTGLGYAALSNDTTGQENTAVGTNALGNNTTGSTNTVAGVSAMVANTAGSFNTAIGRTALASNTAGDENTALGTQAMLDNSSGSANIAIGSNAGRNLTTGSSNIDIGNWGVAGESNTVRIGTVGTQSATYIAGINGATSASGVAVYVNSSGQLGTLTSSARYKRDVQDMGRSTDALMKLRPVRFRYRSEIDPSGVEQYGLVAEEVAKVYPDLVVYDADGRPQTVRYHFVNAMLLNEVQKQHREIEEQASELRELRQRLERLEAAASDPEASVSRARSGVAATAPREAVPSGQGM
jgi:trimeric autotransporter adhesin